MLLDDFYTIHDLSGQPDEAQGTITATLVFNPGHKIFEGHFPGLPVVPGVCMMLIIKEILEFRLQQKLLLRSASQVKFLSVIVPHENARVMAEVQFQSTRPGEIEIAARLYYGNLTFFKLKARLEKV